MSAEPLESQLPSPETPLHLPPAAIDWATYKTQLVLTSFVAVFATVGLNWFLLDNSLSPGESSFLNSCKMLFAAPAEFWSRLATFAAAGTGDGLVSVAITGLLATIGLSSPFAQHLLNLGILATSALLVAQITSELTSRVGNRLGAAAPIWAAVLFVLSPAQSEYLLSLNMRAEMLCQLLYLYSIFAYLRFRATSEKKMFSLSLISTVLAFLTRPEAAAIPLVITASEIILPGTTATKNLKVQQERRTQHFILVIFFWLALSFVTTVGNLAPELVPVLHAPKFLTDSLTQATPLSWLLPMPADHLSYKIALGGYLFVAIAFAGQCLFRSAQIRAMLWLAVWLVAATAMHSAIFAIILSIAALPSAGALSRARSRPIIACGLAGLTLVSVAWFHFSHEQSVELETQWQTKPASQLIWPHSFETPATRLEPMYSFQINTSTLPQVTFAPSDAIRQEGTPFSSDKASVTPMPDGVRIFPGKQTVRMWLPPVKLNPKEASVAAIKLLYTSKTGCHTCHSDSLKLLWRAAGNETQTNSATILNITFGQYLVWLGRYADWTNGNLISKVGFEFDPGDYYVDVASVDLIPYALTAPILAFRSAETISRHTGAVTKVSPHERPEVDFDVRLIPGAAGIKVAINKGADQTQPVAEKDIYAFHNQLEPVNELDINATTGRLALPNSMLSSPGMYQVRAVALNGDRVEIGLPTEPWTFEVTVR